MLFKEDKLRGKPGYEHLSDPLHILIEAEFPTAIIDSRLRHAKEIIEELLKPVVSYLYAPNYCVCESYIYICYIIVWHAFLLPTVTSLNLRDLFKAALLISRINSAGNAIFIDIRGKQEK